MALEYQSTGIRSTISKLQMTLIYWSKIEINFKAIWNGWMKQERAQSYRQTLRRQEQRLLGKRPLKGNWRSGADIIRNVTDFIYLRSLLTWDNDCNKEIKRRLARATGAMVGFKTMWNSKHTSTQKKIDIIRKCVMSVLLYACETQTLRKTDKD
jgi:hypothetical protein